MGVIDLIFGTLFGGSRNVVKETAEIFRENAEAGAVRSHDLQTATLQQFAAEFAHPRKGWFDRFIDGLNRVPRPAMALGVLGLMVAAMTDPIWFASRMQGIALVPEPLWWLLGAIVSFYFGARHQAKGQDFQQSIAATMARAPEVTRNIGALQALTAGAGQAPGAEADYGSGENPALTDWRDAHER
ncbi:MAG: carboxylesterase [Rhodobacteraceae bacterium]|nr:carboxylesterase [Paracoccaceae bacterium]